MQIPLANDKGFVLIDDSDYELVKDYSWHIHRSSNRDYARAWINGRREYMHRLICPAELVDHINNNGLDNRRSNLRSASKSLNALNSKVRNDNTTGYKGVAFSHGKYVAEISKDGKRHYLGRFDTAEDASQAYLTALANL